MKDKTMIAKGKEKQHEKVSSSFSSICAVPVYVCRMRGHQRGDKHVRFRHERGGRLIHRGKKRRGDGRRLHAYTVSAALESGWRESEQISYGNGI